jgi:hypothetical protein
VAWSQSCGSCACLPDFISQSKNFLQVTAGEKILSVFVQHFLFLFVFKQK